jgi:hypothetical protein
VYINGVRASERPVGVDLVADFSSGSLYGPTSYNKLRAGSCDSNPSSLRLARFSFFRRPLYAGEVALLAMSPPDALLLPAEASGISWLPRWNGSSLTTLTTQPSPVTSAEPNTLILSQLPLACAPNSVELRMGGQAVNNSLFSFASRKVSGVAWLSLLTPSTNLSVAVESFPTQLNDGASLRIVPFILSLRLTVNATLTADYAVPHPRPRTIHQGLRSHFTSTIRTDPNPIRAADAGNAHDPAQWNCGSQ